VTLHPGCECSQASVLCDDWRVVLPFATERRHVAARGGLALVDGQAPAGSRALLELAEN